MKFLRVFSPLLLVLAVFIAQLYPYSPGTCIPTKLNHANNIWSVGYHTIDFSPFINGMGGEDIFEDFTTDAGMTIIKTPTDGGIREDISAKYRDRFEKWKAEFLSTDFGRQQWDKYANDKHFILTIVISDKKGKGAGTDKYLWDDAGTFVGATITLGNELNEGYPNPIYYPVMNSLSSGETSYSISGKILAAAKISHEIGHVNQTAGANRSFMQLQNSLMPVYTSIFLKNGRNTRDKKLVDLERQMGGTPVEIWESREYWSEINAMQFLNERIVKEDYRCFVFNKIKQNVETYARDYEPRFDKYSEFANSPCWK